MPNHATMLDRIIREEVYTLADEFVGHLQRTPWVHDPVPCLAKDSFREPVKDAIRCESPDTLRAVCEWLGYEPTADAKAILADIEADDAWEEAADFLDIESHTIKAMQFWLVSDWLAERLEDSGALVARDVMGLNIWGRTERSQGLHMDSDLKAVAAHYGTAE